MHASLPQHSAAQAPLARFRVLRDSFLLNLAQTRVRSDNARAQASHRTIDLTMNVNTHMR